MTALVILLTGAAGIWMVVQQRSSRPKIRHIVLISLDTVRADYLSCYGFEKPTTPNIDSLAEQGFLFSHAMTPIPLTLPAHTSMLTGTIPPHHGTRFNGEPNIDPSLVSLASLLKSKDYSTGAFIGAQVLNGSFGLDRGFDIYHDQFDNPSHERRRGEEVNRAAFSWLEQQKGNPVFLFMHYYDAHAAYLPPEPFATTFKEDLYAGEIAYADHCIGQVISKLKSLDMYDSSLIIVTGDHGEMLGEHGEKTHGYFIYQSVLKVPLIFKLPGLNTAHRIDDQATSIIDVVPTVCDLLDIEPPQGIEGKNLAGYFGDQPPMPEDRYLYCESLEPTTYGANALTGLVSTKWKYIHTTRPELYDLQTDPGEQTNLVEEQSRLFGILKENLSQISEQAARQGKVLEETPIPIRPELIRHLQSLGYVGEIRVDEDISFDESKEDPKDLVEYHNAWWEASHLWLDGKPDEALIAIEGALKRCPVFVFTDLATRIYRNRGDYENAIRYGEMAVASRPGFFKAHEQLAFAYSFAKQDEAAAEHFELTLQLIPPNQPDFHARRVRLYFQMGMTSARLKKFDLAITQLDEALNLSTQLPGVLNQPLVLNALASALLDSSGPNRDPARALQVAQQACSMTQMKYPAFLKTLARAYAGLNNFDEAIKVTGQALSLASAAGDTTLIAELQQQLVQFRLKAPGAR